MSQKHDELNMDKELKDKLIVIVIEKLLFALLILLAGFLINRSMEKYKLIAAEQVRDASKIVLACSDLWALVSDYERCLNELDDLNTQQWLSKMFEKKENQNLKEQIEKKKIESKTKLDKFEAIITQKRHIIGEILTMHYRQYLSFLNVRNEAKFNSLYAKTEFSKNNSHNVIEEMNRKLAHMRFSINEARKYAISQLP